MVRAIERQAHHLQRAGHSHLFDLAGLGEPALEVDMLERCERVLDAVPLAIAGKLLGVELAPTAPRCARCLMPLGEAGQPCCDSREQLGTVHVGLLDARELPDHLPVFLEYLSMCDDAEIGRWLGEIRHILALLTARLEERGADHALVPLSLLALIGAEGDVEEHRPQVKKEAPDNTPEALDAVWEEEAVRFSATSDEDCALQSAEGRRLAERKHTVQSQPVRIMPAPSLNASSAPSADR